ncbi:MAG: acireductone synthase [Rudaea sp.]
MIRAILTDIEGTTSSISFVKEVLFAYARKLLPAFIVTHADKPEVQHWLHEAAREAGLVSAGQDEIIALLQRWIDEDRKSTSLKELQGMIWKQGYENGDYRAHIYPEVPAKLRAWHAQGLRIYVYSSGSIEAQKLFFGFSDAGDLRGLFDGYFDTQTGAKRDAESYRHIAKSIDLPAADIVFLSDIEEELDAARTAGMQTVLLARAPATCPAQGNHACVDSFEALDFASL